MREDSLDLVRKHLPDDEESLKALPKSSRELILQVRDCYSMQLADPFMSRKEIRDRLVDQHHISLSQAYNVIALTMQLLGDVSTSHKNWIKIKAEALMEEAYKAAKNKNFPLAAELRKQAKTLGYLFRLDTDEGELLEAWKHLNIESVQITVNPNDIGIKFTEKQKAKADDYFRKFTVDADYEEVKEDQE